MGDRSALVVSPVATVAEREPDPLKGGDVYGWAMDQAALIRAGRYDEIDWVNVADEIESVGKSEFKSLASHVEIVLLHMLKWDHQPSRRSRSWALSITEHRERIADDLADNPSLKPRQDEAVGKAYRLARLAAARQTKLPLQTFAVASPYDWEEIVTRSFVLDQTDDTP